MIPKEYYEERIILFSPNHIPIPKSLSIPGAFSLFQNPGRAGHNKFHKHAEVPCENPGLV